MDMDNAALKSQQGASAASGQAPATLSGRLARFVAELDWEDLPGEVVSAAKRHLLDIVGVGIVGSRQEMARRALAGLRTMQGSAGPVRVWGTGETLATGHAALANGVSAHVLDYDDTHTQSITHGSAVLGPAVLALGEEVGATGRELITAFVAGWEVTARVGLAANGSFHQRGFHTTSVAGVFGATAAAAKLLKLSADETLNALGLTGSQVSGVSEYLSNGSSSKSFHAGWSAMSGIVAANLSRAGMTGPATVFEGRYGTFKTHGVESECDPALVAADLGTRWESTRISIKPYPCCHFAHAFIDCVLEMRRQGVASADVQSLHCVVPEIELPLICEPFQQKLKPDSAYAAKFSLPFLLAAALVDGRVDLRTFGAENIRRADLLELAGRVSYRVAQPGETTFPRYFPGWVEARLAGGGSLVQRLDVNRGNPDSPLEQSALEEKFKSNVEGVLDDAGAADLIAALARLDELRVTDIAALLARCR
jgi:2-methylcitrate dehydratase PrpD